MLTRLSSGDDKSPLSLVMLSQRCQANDLSPLSFFQYHHLMVSCLSISIHRKLPDEFSGLHTSDKSLSASSLSTEKFESKHLLLLLPDHMSQYIAIPLHAATIVVHLSRTN